MSQAMQNGQPRAGGSGGTVAAADLTGQPTEDAEEIRSTLVEFLTSSDLDEGTTNMLQNLISKDIVLAYLTEAEVREYKWKLRIKREEFLALHPADDCLVTGQYRAAINDDRTDTLTPLDARQKMQVLSFFDMAETLVTRARGMKQQEMINTEIREHRAEDNRGSESESGGILGKIRRS